MEELVSFLSKCSKNNPCSEKEAMEKFKIKITKRFLEGFFNSDLEHLLKTKNLNRVSNLALKVIDEELPVIEYIVNNLPIVQPISEY